MTILRKSIAALMMVPVLALNASPSTGAMEADRSDLRSTHSVTGACWIWWNGHWYQVPC